MPIKVIRVDIFVSSPSDLLEERKIIRRVIERLNRSSLRDSYFLVPLLYEDEVPPEIGKEAQLIVDRYKQVKNSYIMISLLWTRMGTPFTIIEAKERYESGTQYEILKGYENFQEKGQPHILLYRKEKENPSADPIQKEKVEKFFNDFMGNPPKLNGLFAKYTDLAEFEVKIEDHLTKLIQTYPPKTENPIWFEPPEFREELRRIDAAMPRQTAIGETTPVQVMICLPDSEGLRALLLDDTRSNYKIKKRDVQAGGLTIAFPMDKTTGRLGAAFVTIDIEADDFKIVNNSMRIRLTHYQDSGQITFNLIPIYSRKYSTIIVRIRSTALDGSEVECGSVVLYTVVKATKGQMALQTIWDLVSRSLTIASASQRVSRADIIDKEAMQRREAKLVLPSYPIYSKVEAGTNGAFLWENPNMGSAKISGGEIIVENNIYTIYSLSPSDNWIQIDDNSKYCWVRVSGRSMNRASPIPIEDGDYILFRVSPTVENSTIVVASIPDESGAYQYVVKRYVNGEFISYSTEYYRPLKMNADTRILGTVVAVAKPTFTKLDEI